MNLKKIIELAGKIKNIGKNRISINTSKLVEQFKPQYSRDAVRKYFTEGLLKVKPIKGTTRHITTLPKKIQKGKRKWLVQVRRLRKNLRTIYKQTPIDNKIYRQIYLKIKANIIKTNKQLQTAYNDKYKL